MPTNAACPGRVCGKPSEPTTGFARAHSFQAKRSAFARSCHAWEAEVIRVLAAWAASEVLTVGLTRWRVYAPYRLRLKTVPAMLPRISAKTWDVNLAMVMSFRGV